MHDLVLAATDGASTVNLPTVIIAGLALLVAIYGAGLSTVNARRDRAREAARKKSEIEIGLREENGIGEEGAPLIIGETVLRRHLLLITVSNRGEAPEYVHGVRLESETHPAIFVVVRRAEGTVEVRPRDQQDFTLPLDGSKAFDWQGRFRVMVKLANDAVIRSPWADPPYPPEHGLPFVIPDPDAVPDDQVRTIRPADFSPD